MTADEVAGGRVEAGPFLAIINGRCLERPTTLVDEKQRNRVHHWTRLLASYQRIIYTSTEITDLEAKNRQGAKHT